MTKLTSVIFDDLTTCSKLIVLCKTFSGSHHGKVAEGFETSLKNLGLDYIDLYLIHWPIATDENGKRSRFNRLIPVLSLNSIQIGCCLLDNTLQPDQYPTIIDTWKLEKLVETGESVHLLSDSLCIMSSLTDICTTK